MNKDTKVMLAVFGGMVLIALWMRSRQPDAPVYGEFRVPRRNPSPPTTGFNNPAVVPDNTFGGGLLPRLLPIVPERGGTVRIPRRPRKPIRGENLRGFSVGSLNVRGGLNNEKAGQDFTRALTRGIDVIGFQEIGASADATNLARIARMRGYATHGTTTPIAWKRDEWREADSGSFFLSEATPVGKAGAGPSTLRAKDAEWVLLVNKRNPRIRKIVVNVHLAPSIYIAARSRLHRQQIANLAKGVRRLRGKHPGAAVYIVGDFNANYRKRGDRLRFTRLLSMGFIPNWRLGFPERGTHGNRYIDYVWSLGDRPRKQRVDSSFNTDHNMIVTEY